MISATTFARQSSIWRQVTPTLEQFVRWANANITPTGSSVLILADSDRIPLIAEVAFNLAATPEPIGDTLAMFVDPGIEARAREFILRLPRGAAAAGKLNPNEWGQSFKLARAIRSFTDKLGANVEYSPRVPGCGTVMRTNADVRQGDRLVEVKAVARPFRGSDFRQLLTYTAMYYAAGAHIESLTLLNPRLGEKFEMPLGSVAAGVCGKSSVELMQELVAYMTGLQTSA